jgi:hypothetical protein
VGGKDILSIRYQRRKSCLDTLQPTDPTGGEKKEKRYTTDRATNAPKGGPVRLKRVNRFTNAATTYAGKYL